MRTNSSGVRPRDSRTGRAVLADSSAGGGLSNITLVRKAAARGDMGRGSKAFSGGAWRVKVAAGASPAVSRLAGWPVRGRRLPPSARRRQRRSRSGRSIRSADRAASRRARRRGGRARSGSDRPRWRASSGRGQSGPGGPGHEPAAWECSRGASPGRGACFAAFGAPLGVRGAGATISSRIDTGAAASGTVCAEGWSRHFTSTVPSFSPRSPMTTRRGMPIRSASLNFTPGRRSRSSTSTSTP